MYVLTRPKGVAYRVQNGIMHVQYISEFGLF